MATRNRTNDPARHDTDTDTHRHGDENRDPITGAPGAHPVGAGIGAAGGAAAGAAAGAIGGPVGIVAGGIVGGLLGGLAGKGVAEYVDPTEEHNYWRENYKTRDYVERDRDYETYAPAYQYGWESYSRYDAENAATDTGARTDTAATSTTSRSFDDIESDLRAQWNKHRSDNDLTWDQARPATMDAWNRVHQRRQGGGAGGTGATGATGV